MKLRSMLAACSWSGGKDSALACDQAMRRGYRIGYLLNMVSADTGRDCFHGLDRRLIRAQAKAMGVPLIQKAVGRDMRSYEEDFKKALAGLRRHGVRTMVFGDIYLAEHKEWVDRVCRESGLRALEPLWHRKPKAVMREFLRLGFQAVVVSVKSGLFGKGDAGRPVDRAWLRDLDRRRICPCGENGEYHTFVHDGPLFKKPVHIVSSRVVFRRGFWDHYALDVKKWH